MHPRVLRDLVMSLLSHSPLPLKDPRGQEKFPWTEGKPLSLQSS